MDLLCPRLHRLALLMAAVFFLLSWLLPNHSLPWMTAYQEFASFFAAIVLVFSLLSGVIRLSFRVFVFFLISLIPLIQYAAGVIVFSGDAWVVFFYLLAFSFMLLVGYNLSVEPASRAFFAYLLAVFFVAGAVFSLWLALYQWLQLSASVWVVDLPYGSRPFANFAQPNNLATMLCMGVAGLVYLYEKNFLGRVVSAFLAALLVFGIALTSSRTPWISGLLFFVFWIFKSRVVSLRLGVGALFFWAGLYVFFIAVLPYISECLLLSVQGVGLRSGGLERLDLWRQFWLAVMKGKAYGWNQISYAQVAMTLEFPLAVVTEHSHNFILDIFLWNGLVLGGVINLFVVCWGGFLFYRAKNKESLFAMVASIFILTHGMLEFPLEYAFFLFPLGLLIGVIESEFPSGFSLIVPRRVLVGVLGVAIVFFLRALYEYRAIEDDVQLLRFENARIDVPKTVERSNVYFFSQLVEWVKYARAIPSSNMSAAELEAARLIAYRYPNAPSLLKYVQMLYVNGYHDAVRENMLILRGLHGGERYKEGCQILSNMDGKQFAELKDLLSDCWAL